MKFYERLNVKQQSARKITKMTTRKVTMYVIAELKKEKIETVCSKMHCRRK
jgi:hypothetical protein